MRQAEYCVQIPCRGTVMNLSTLLDHLFQSPTDPTILRALAAALGLELARRHTDAVPQALRALTDGEIGSDPSAAAYTRALRDLLGAFQAEVGRESRRRELPQHARREPYRSVMLALAGGCETPTDIAPAIGRDPSSTSRALQALADAGLVEGYENSHDRRRHPYRLTADGEAVVEQLRRSAPLAAAARASEASMAYNTAESSGIPSELPDSDSSDLPRRLREAAAALGDAAAALERPAVARALVAEGSAGGPAAPMAAARPRR
jgi:DNA-binding MarR family transcriptional regulator